MPSEHCWPHRQVALFIRRQHHRSRWLFRSPREPLRDPGVLRDGRWMLASGGPEGFSCDRQPRAHNHLQTTVSLASHDALPDEEAASAIQDRVKFCTCYHSRAQVAPATSLPTLAGRTKHFTGEDTGFAVRAPVAGRPFTSLAEGINATLGAAETGWRPESQHG